MNTKCWIIVPGWRGSGTVGAYSYNKYVNEEDPMSKYHMSPVDTETIWQNGFTMPLTERLEDFFDKNDVGMNAVSSWNDEEILSITYYDLMKWYTLDEPFAKLSLGIMEPISTGSALSLKENVDFISSVYWSWGGSFRYDIPV